ncbi:HAD-IA family hydrolase [Phreatobacter stygius]|uniref:HAD family hydrolase n=1 Tax=Phreatobacter stygius TaxID=1940610 RepID=A0A4D7BDM9_9HYPH|nr:HAD-IA family hydrolase [Phreatobacter stygius]QCI68653.1 HAD family hydrolase [Phreatobacter stygius]
MKLVIFDCDGTLVDSQHMIVAAMNGAFAALDRPAPTREATLSIVGLSLHEAFVRLTRADDSDIPALIEAYKNAFHDLRADASHTEPLYEGALAVVEALAGDSDVVLGIATGKSQRGVRLVLGHHGIFQHFATIQTADDAPSKPHPAMIEQAMAAVGATPAATVMIGDTTFDIDMAQAAGVTPIGVAWGYHPVEALKGAGARVVLDRFAELPAALAQIWHPAGQGGKARP